VPDYAWLATSSSSPLLPLNMSISQMMLLQCPVPMNISGAYEPDCTFNSLISSCISSTLAGILKIANLNKVEGDFMMNSAIPFYSGSTGL